MKVRVPLGLEWCVDGERAVDIPGATVREVWANLHAAYPELMWRLSLEQGPPSFWVRILVDGHQVDQLSGLDTAVSETSEVALHILPGSGPAAGACGPPPDAASPGQASCRARN